MIEAFLLKTTLGSFKQWLFAGVGVAFLSLLGYQQWRLMSLKLSLADIQTERDFLRISINDKNQHLNQCQRQYQQALNDAEQIQTDETVALAAQQSSEYAATELQQATARYVCEKRRASVHGGGNAYPAAENDRGLGIDYLDAVGIGLWNAANQGTSPDTSPTSETPATGADAALPVAIPADQGRAGNNAAGKPRPNHHPSPNLPAAPALVAGVAAKTS
jgi:hypothetical protein